MASSTVVVGRRIVIVAVAALTVSFGLEGHADAGFGSEIPVNVTTLGWQNDPSVAADSAGNFVVVWTGPAPHDSEGIVARIFDNRGQPLSGEIAVNTFTTGEQDDPFVAVAGDGDFVVVWESDDEDGDEEGVFARRFSADGTPRDVNGFQVSAVATDQQLDPCVAIDDAGNFVVVWEAFPNFDGSAGAVYARLFFDNGTAAGGDIAVNTTTFDGQRDPVVAMRPGGGFVVAWESASQDSGSSWGIFARVFDASGLPLTGEIPVNSSVTGDQRDPSVSVNGDGDFAVAWQSDDQDGSSTAAMVRVFDSTGAAITPQIQVNSNALGWQGNPSVAITADGSFRVVFEDGVSDLDTRRQDFLADGTPVGDQPPVNTYTSDDQDDARLDLTDSGFGVFAWESTGQDGDENGIYARLIPLFGVFGDGFESGDTSSWTASVP